MPLEDLRGRIASTSVLVAVTVILWHIGGIFLQDSIPYTVAGAIILAAVAGIAPATWFSPVAAAATTALFLIVQPAFGGPCYTEPTCEPVPLAVTVPLSMLIVAGICCVGAVARTIFDWRARRRRLLPPE